MKKQLVLKKAINGGVVVGSFVGLQYLTAILTQVILARILEPSHFGLLAFVSMIAFFFHHVGNIHGDKYLVKVSKITQEKLNNVFTLELILAFIVFIFVIIIAPYIMEVLGKTNQTIYVQFLALVFFHTPLSRIKAMHERDLSFVKAYLPTLVGQIMGGATAVVLAMNGYGIWSLLWWRVSTLFGEIVVLWSISSFRPKLSIDKSIYKDIVDYGKPLLLSSILIYLYGNYDYYVVDKLTSVDQLGYYWLAFQISHYFLNARTAINKVIFPALSRLNERKDRFNLFVAMTDATSFFYLIPTIVILFFGDELITLIFGIKWMPAAILFKVFFVIVLFKAIAGNIGPLLHAEGNTKGDFQLSIIGFVAIIPVVYIATFYGGILGAAFGIFIVGLIQIIFGYSMFIKPVTGHGFLYYLWKPIIFMLFICSTVLLLNYFNSGFLFKIFLFIISISLAVIIFYPILKSLHSQLKANIFN
ncbi:oligosaccharide flippase family protein [Flavobacteriales bacterium]|nr:oligosaccharide flippase family protein [Flavobacteriales bacterium]